MIYAIFWARISTATFPKVWPSIAPDLRGLGLEVQLKPLSFKIILNLSQVERLQQNTAWSAIFNWYLFVSDNPLRKGTTQKPCYKPSPSRGLHCGISSSSLKRFIRALRTNRQTDIHSFIYVYNIENYGWLF